MKSIRKKIICGLVIIMALGLIQATATTAYTISPANPLDEPYTTFLPLIINPPAKANVTLVNSTGGTLCFEILGTGIGERCFPSAGSHFYGEFWPGTYQYIAAARCGSLQKTRTFAPGESVIFEYYCSRGGVAFHNPSSLTPPISQ
jgi:hypothetical protein